MGKTLHIGIVGHEAAKFTPEGEAAAKALIRELLADPCVVVSGHCHLGGIDIWAEEIAAELGHETLIFPPKRLSWADGYKPRNIQIAERSDVVHCIAVDRLAPTYTGMRFNLCYHCGTTDHVKGGGCWTMKEARKRGRSGVLHIVDNHAASLSEVPRG